MTLQEIKDKVSKEKGYENWSDCVNHLPKWSLEDLLSTISKRYAKANLEEAAEKIDNLTIDSMNPGYYEGYESAKYDCKQIIKNTPLD